MKPLYVLAVMSVVLTLASCGSTKKAATTTAEPDDVPAVLQKYPWAAMGTGRSGDKGKAYRDALRTAQATIASDLENAISIVADQYGGDIRLNDADRSEGSNQERILSVIENAVHSIRVVQGPTFTQESGMWNCEVWVIEDQPVREQVSKDVYNGLSDDDVLRVKFDEQQFVDVYNQALEDYRNRNKK